MELNIAYENSQGEVLLFAPENGLFLFDNELRNASWSYSINNGTVSSFFKEPKELELKIGIFTDSAIEGLNLRELIIAFAEGDVARNKPGRLIINGWALPCFIIGREYEAYWYDGRICEITLNILCEELTWYHENEHHIFLETDTPSEYEFLDFSYNFPYDLNAGFSKISEVTNNGLMECDSIIRFYGPTSNPAINLAGNTYGVNISVAENSRIEINTKEKSVLLIDSYGNETNVFGYRVSGGESSNSYIFKKIPVGVSEVSSNSEFNYDVVVREMRSEPEWS